jgi:CheY-like chemotaxis protein
MTTTVSSQINTTGKPGQPSVSAQPPVANANQIKVLVVDDFVIVRRVVGRMIQKQLGLSIIEAGDGQEALDVIDHEAPTIVLTDMQMPRMNGLALVAAVRDKHPSIPVILMTAQGSEELAVQALRAGAASYVPKKEMDHTLADTLNRVLAVVALNTRRQRVMSCLEVREAQLKLESDPDLIGPLIELLLADLAVMDLCDSTARIQVGVALSEAIVNALYHGNLEISSALREADERPFYALADERRRSIPYRERRIVVQSRIDRQMARFVVRDEGPGFDTTNVGCSIAPEDIARIGGRGLLLIRAFMDQVHHNQAGNQITLIKRGRTLDGKEHERESIEIQRPR